MADVSSLGNLTVQIDSDPAKIEASLKLLEARSVASGKKIEAAIESSFDRAYKEAQRAIKGISIDLEASGKIGPAANLKIARAIIKVREEAVKAHGSIDRATDAEKAKYVELEEQLKKLRVEAGKPRAATLYDQPIGPAKPLSDLEAATKRSNDRLIEYQATYEETGNVGAANIKRLVAAEQLHLAAIEATFGSLDKASDEAKADYEKVRLGVVKAKKEVVALTEEFRDQRQELNKYGAEWNGLFSAIEQKLGKKGVALGKGALALTAFKEGWGIGKSVGGAFGVSDAGLDNLAKTVQRISKPTVNRLGDITGAIVDLQLALVNGNKFSDVLRGYAIDAGSAKKQTGLFAPINSQAFRLKTEQYDRTQNPRLPLLPRLQYQRDRAQTTRDMLAATNASINFDAFKEADIAVSEATNAIDAFNDANAARIAQLDLEHATMTNNKGDINALSAELDHYTAAEMKRAGVSDANIALTVSMGKANRELTFTLRDLSEELETLGLQQANAQFESDFDQQRQLTEQTGRRSVQIANLTGKSKEYVAALQNQIAQQRIQIDINEILRAQETIDLRMQVQQGYGNIELQKKLAAISNENAVAIARKERRTREYIDALVALGKIEQAQLNMERIQQTLTLTQGDLELAQMRDELSLTGEYGAAIESLTAEMARLNIERLDASANWVDNAMANVLRQKEALRPEMQAMQARRELVELDRQIAAQHLSIQEQTRRSEIYANEQSVANYRSMVTQNVITKEQGDALIARSQDLLMERLRDINASYGKDWERWAERLAIKYNDQASRIGDAMERIADAGQSALSDGLFSSITEGLDGLEDAFQNFGRAVLREITNIIASKAMAQLLSFLPTVLGHGSSVPAYAQMANLIGSANGNVLRGGFKAFASGGVVKYPTLGLIGEGRYNEAVVPLPDGRSIPVEMQGGRGNAPTPVHVEVVWSPEFVTGIVRSAADQGAAQASRMVIPIVAEDLLRNGTLRRVIQASV